MTTHATDYIDAVWSLRAGMTLTLTGVSWEEYERLLAEAGDHRGTRLSYDQGRLDAVSPPSKHERCKEFISHLARTAANISDIDLESLGSTTLRHVSQQRGAEPDVCFYVQNAAEVIGREQIDLSVDPPPDVVVEIDLSHQSTNKLGIYAEMGIRELWRYDGHLMKIYELRDQRYIEAEFSPALPVLSAKIVSEFLKKAQAEGQSAALRSFKAEMKRRGE